MNAEIFHLWSTPVLIVPNAAPADLTRSLVEGLETGRYSDPKKLHLEPRSFHEVHDLKQIIETHAARLGHEYFGGPCSAEVQELWSNIHQAEDTASVHSMHAHPRYHMICTFYPEVAGGDLFLHNPQGGTLWSGAKHRGPMNNFSIRPEPRMMVFFPGYVIHNTTPNLSGMRRICIPANISLKFEDE